MKKERSKRGFTDRLGIFLVMLLTIGMGLSFFLAVQSIKAQYMGSLACWTACYTPLGLGIDIVLNSIVKKNQAENTSGNGDGIRYRQIVADMSSERGEATI